MLAPPSSVFVIFYSHTISGIATWFCFVLLLVYSTRVYPLWKKVWALGLALISFVFSMIFFFLRHEFSIAGFVLLLHAFPAMFFISFGLAFLSFM